jgi:hypothetical protein
MQPSTVNAVILRTFKEKNNWIRASKLLEDLDHYMIGRRAILQSR